VSNTAPKFSNSVSAGKYSGFTPAAASKFAPIHVEPVRSVPMASKSTPSVFKRPPVSYSSAGFVPGYSHQPYYSFNNNMLLWYVLLSNNTHAYGTTYTREAPGQATESIEPQSVQKDGSKVFGIVLFSVLIFIVITGLIIVLND
jgi:hypothetical protein